MPRWLQRGRKLNVVSIYHDINHRTLDIPITELIRSSPNVLVAGDTNAHSTLWGSPVNNPRGDHWDEFIIANDLNVLNWGTDPTFSNHIADTHIDVSLCSDPRLVRGLDEYQHIQWVRPLAFIIYL